MVAEADPRLKLTTSSLRQTCPSSYSRKVPREVCTLLKMSTATKSTLTIWILTLKEPLFKATQDPRSPWGWTKRTICSKRLLWKTKQSKTCEEVRWSAATLLEWTTCTVMEEVPERRLAKWRVLTAATTWSQWTEIRILPHPSVTETKSSSLVASNYPFRRKASPVVLINCNGTPCVTIRAKTKKSLSPTKWSTSTNSLTSSSSNPRWWTVLMLQEATWEVTSESPATTTLLPTWWTASAPRCPSAPKCQPFSKEASRFKARTSRAKITSLLRLTTNSSKRSPTGTSKAETGAAWATKCWKTRKESKAVSPLTFCLMAASSSTSVKTPRTVSRWLTREAEVGLPILCSSTTISINITMCSRCNQISSGNSKCHHRPKTTTSVAGRPKRAPLAPWAPTPSRINNIPTVYLPKPFTLPPNFLSFNETTLSLPF